MSNKLASDDFVPVGSDGKPLEEPKFAVQPHDDDEFYYVVASEFKNSMDAGNLSAMSFKEWAKKYKKRFGVSGESYMSKTGKKSKM